MPGQDKTGPLGQGQLTGRGLGPCGVGLARGLGFRRGFGRNFRFFQQPITEKQEKELLKQKLKVMEQEKQELEKRLKELKS